MPDDESVSQRRIDRRSLLRLIASSGAVATTGFASTLAGCSTPEADARTAVPISDLPLDRRVRVLHQDLPVEVVRTADGVSARSLWCTHMGCEVRWSDEQRQYLCPCHEGIYNSSGFPIKGPPPRPLSTIPVEVTDNGVLIGNRA